MGVPRAQFVVLGADRLWTNALPEVERPALRAAGPAGEDRAPRVAAARHRRRGPRHARSGAGHGEHIRKLITPLDRSGLRFEAIVELLRPDLHEKLEAVRGSRATGARRQPDGRRGPDPPEGGAADPPHRVRREGSRDARLDPDRRRAGTRSKKSPPRGAVAWPDVLDPFYTKGPFAGASALFGYSIQEPTKLAAHVRRVIEAGIQRGRSRELKTATATSGAPSTWCSSTPAGRAVSRPARRPDRAISDREPARC